MVKNRRDVSDLLAWQKQKDDKLFDSLLDKSRKEQELTTFVPQISDNSKKIADSIGNHGKKKKIEDRLYDYNSKSKPITPKPASKHGSSKQMNKNTNSSQFLLQKTPVNARSKKGSKANLLNCVNLNQKSHSVTPKSEFDSISNKMEVSRIINQNNTPFNLKEACYNNEGYEIKNNYPISSGRRVSEPRCQMQKNMNGYFSSTNLNMNNKGYATINNKKRNIRKNSENEEIEKESQLIIKQEVENTKESYNELDNFCTNNTNMNSNRNDKPKSEIDIPDASCEMNSPSHSNNMKTPKDIKFLEKNLISMQSSSNKKFYTNQGKKEKYFTENSNKAKVSIDEFKYLEEKASCNVDSQQFIADNKVKNRLPSKSPKPTSNNLQK